VGSDFTVFVPLASALQPAPRSPEAPVQPFQGFRALAVDDNPTNLLVLQKLLERLGINSTRATDGEAGVALAISGNFDVILMDCHMPVMDGFEATRRIRAVLPNVPIIAVTASALEEDRIACGQAGMDAFLTKPVSLAGLANSLHQLLVAPSAEDAPAPQTPAAAAS
jgi:CheY-like chemotaxis protein